MSAREYTRKTGWHLMDEHKPSLCKHYLPAGGGDHVMTVYCWCEPTLQGEPALNPPYTVVLHNDIVRGAA